MCILIMSFGERVLSHNKIVWIQLIHKHIHFKPYLVNACPSLERDFHIVRDLFKIIDFIIVALKLYNIFIFADNSRYHFGKLVTFSFFFVVFSKYIDHLLQNFIH